MKRFLLLMVTALTVISSATSFAGRNDDDNDRDFDKKVKKKAPEFHHTTIVSVNADSITIKGAKQSRTYKITQNTDIRLQGQKAGASDLAVGMMVDVSAGTDPNVASMINATEAPSHPAPKDTKKEDKKKK